MTKDLWNATLYDTQHQFVSQYGESLIALLQPQPNEYILDVGCGTGDLANEISLFGAIVVGVDQSENMIIQAKKKFPTLQFEVRDAKNLIFNQQFDAVFSNATLHWIKEPTQALQSIHQSLKANGRFVAEFGGAGNVKIITDELIKQIKLAGIDYEVEQFPWYFPTIGEYTQLMENVGFHVALAQHYDRPTKLDGEHGLRNWLSMFSPSLFEHVTEATKEKILEKTIENLRSQLCVEDAWYADYKRLRVIAVKK